MCRLPDHGRRRARLLPARNSIFCRRIADIVVLIDVSARTHALIVQDIALHLIDTHRCCSFDARAQVPD
jgi:hypothetical protein